MSSNEDKEIDDSKFKDIIDEWKNCESYVDFITLKKIPNIKIKYSFIECKLDESINYFISKLEKEIGYKDAVAHDFSIKLLKFSEQLKNKNNSRFYDYKVELLDNKSKVLHLFYSRISSNSFLYFFGNIFTMVVYTQYEQI